MSFFSNFLGELPIMQSITVQGVGGRGGREPVSEVDDQRDDRRLQSSGFVQRIPGFWRFDGVIKPEVANDNGVVMAEPEGCEVCCGRRHGGGLGPIEAEAGFTNAFQRWSTRAAEVDVNPLY